MRNEMQTGLLGHDSQPEQNKLNEKKNKKKISGPPTDTDYQPFDWKKLVYSKKYIPLWILLIVMIVATVLITIFQDKLVDKLRPFSDKVRDIPAGFLIPIAILFVLSFPPLVGDEIVEILCGVIYGLWAGFGIVAAGTFIGQIGNWFLFKHALRKKAFELERTNLNYGAMARMVRDGGFWLLLIIRVSAVPPHISTAVFSTCDVKFWHFLVATFFSLPKNIFLVYLGTRLIKEDDEDDKVETIVFSIILVITIGMAVWLWRKMKAIKTTLLEEQDQRRRAKQAIDGQDEEESIENEWSAATTDLRNYGPVGANYAPAGPTYSMGNPYDPPAGPYNPVPPPYLPTTMESDTAYHGRMGNSSPAPLYNDRPY